MKSSWAKMMVTVAGTLAIVVQAKSARAGGFDIPDLGTEALGRGGAFTAKANDVTAIHHNVGGLAQQRGTHALFNSNVSRSSMSFQREGAYADSPNNAATPWGGRPYPEVTNQGGAVFLPFIGVTSDFGLDWMTVALSTHAPPAAAFAGRYFPLSVNGAPSPARYDAVGGTSSVILLHSAAVGFRVTEWLDIGAAFHLVQASVETNTVSYVDLGSACENREFQPCDARAEGGSKGFTATGSAGALLRPGADVTLGVHLRGPVVMELEGESKTISPRVSQGTKFDPTRRIVKNSFPLILRTGVRKSFMEGKTELGDVELDVIYERWSDAQNPGIVAEFDKLGPQQQPATVTVIHGYKDTMSVRFGGAYNTTVAGLPLTLRGGAYFDSSATESNVTRVDVDTLAKVAATGGVGLKVGAVNLNLAYASVFDVSRTVSDGAIRPVNGAKSGQTVDVNGKPFAAVNNGAYSGHTHIVSLGVSVELDRIFGWGKSAPAAPKDDRPAPRSDPWRDSPRAESPQKAPGGKKPKQTDPHAS